ncbi:MAG: hypothetical protein AAGA54_01515 [Myxococcota bacterium]
MFTACGDDGGGADATGSSTSTSGSTTAEATSGAEADASTTSASTTGSTEGTSSTGADATGASESSEGDGSSSSGEPDDTDVVGLIIRRLGRDTELATFEAARDAYRVALSMEDGAVIDREYEAAVDFSTGMPATPQVFVGMTQFSSAASFQAGAMALNGADAENDYFPLFDVEFFGLLRPRDGGSIDLTALAEDGQVLEVAPRDLSTYDDFDPKTYAQARDAFIEVLSAREGVVAEFQWVSPFDPNVAVGMTVYEDQDAWQAIWTDPTFLESEAFTDFIGGFPPNGGYLNVPVDTLLP